MLAVPTCATTVMCCMWSSPTGRQYWLQVRAFGRWFPNAAEFAAKPLQAKLCDRAGQLMVLKQVFIDLFVNHPLTYFPSFYFLQQSLRTGSPHGWAERYTCNLQDDLWALWRFWIPVQIVNFSCCPLTMRIPFVATLSLAWTCILSCMRGSDRSVIVAAPSSGRAHVDD